MKPEVTIIWVVFAVVFGIIKLIVKQAEKKSNSSSSSSRSVGHDPLLDFFNQLDSSKPKKSSSSSTSNVKSVEDFFKVTTKVPKKKTTIIRPKPVHPKRSTVKDAKVSAQAFIKVDQQDPFTVAEEDPCCDQDITSVFSEEEHAFKNKTVVGKEGSVDHFGDEVCNKHRYEVKGRNQLRQAIVWAEILKKPKALQ